MSRSLSVDTLQAINSRETADVFVPIIKLSHADWAEDARFVADSQDLTHDGELFKALPFTINLPDEEPEGIPTLELRIDNITQHLTKPIRETQGFIGCWFAVVVASRPNFIEVGPMEMDVLAADYDDSEVRAQISVEPILDAAMLPKILNPANAPALF